MTATTAAFTILLPLATQHSGFHPRDASVYFEVPDLQSLADAYSRTSLWRMLSDEDVPTVLGSVAGKESLDPREEIGAAIQQGLDEVGVSSLGETGVLDIGALSFSLVLPVSELRAGPNL